MFLLVILYAQPEPASQPLVKGVVSKVSLKREKEAESLRLDAPEKPATDSATSLRPSSVVSIIVIFMQMHLVRFG